MFHTKQAQGIYFKNGLRKKDSVKLSIGSVISSIIMCRYCKPQEVPTSFLAFFVYIIEFIVNMF